MKKVIVENGRVCGLISGDLPGIEAPDAVEIGWLFDGNEFVPPPAPVFSETELVSIYMNALQKKLDAGAKSWGYDDLRAAVSYIGDPFPRFNAEAVALRDWRSAVWVWAGVEESAIKAGQKALPTPVDQFVAAMPAMPARPVV